MDEVALRALCEFWRQAARDIDAMRIARERIARIADPMRRAMIAHDVFGRGYAEVLSDG